MDDPLHNKPSARSLLVKLSPMIFVFLWATGYPAAKFATSEADPFTFLAIRFAIATVLLGAYVLFILRPGNLDMRQVVNSVLIGVLMQGIYLGGVFYAVGNGLPAGIAALVVALQPFMTAVAAMFVLDEKLSARRSLFFLIALGGIYLVLFPRVEFDGAIPGISLLTVLAIVSSPLAISIGAVFQKKLIVSLNLWVATAAQFAGGTFIMAVAAFLFEERNVEWTVSTILAMAWLILFLSVGAVALLMYLIRRGNSATVASLFYLVPVVSMFMTWVLFGETMNSVQMLGAAIVVACVALASKSQ